MNRKKRIKKSFLSMLLAVLMTLSLLPVSGKTVKAYADSTEVPSEEKTGLTGNDLKMSLLYSGIDRSVDYGRSRLSGSDLQIYDSLKTRIANVAENGGSTIFTVTLDSPVTWTGSSSQADAQFLAKVDYDKIVNCLVVDSPYELYWYDKTAGTEVSYVTSSKGRQTSITKIKFTFFVSDAYQGGSSTRVSTVKASEAESAARTAKSIASQYAALSPYEQMNAFKNEICNLTDYNYSASPNTNYGDPWQLIYVFDGDPGTKVVCEGYAKAFQYLCDLNGLTCYAVTGIMDGGTGAGMHMWNIVTLDGYNYLVDITNSDTGTLGQNGGLFLAGTSGDMDTGYTFQAGNANISYQYDEVQAELYGSEILTLASGDYTPSQPIPEVTASASVQNVTYGYASAPQISAVVQNADGAGYACRWYQVDDQGNAAPVDAASDPYTFILPTGLAAGTYTYYCEINAGGQAAVSNRVTITVEQAEVTPVISGTTTKEYDGTINGPEGISIELFGVISGDSVSAAAKSYAYNSPDPGSADRITASGITLEGADAGSYRLTAETVTASGTITDRAVMETPDEGQSKTEEPEDPAPESPAGHEETQTDVPDDPQPSDSENKQDDAEENKQNKDDGNSQTDAEENKQSEDAGNKQTDAEENKQSEDAGNKQDKAAGNTQTPAPGNTKAGTSGNGQTTADVSRSPKTGDSMDSVMLYAALLVSCVAVIAAAAGRKRKIR